MRKRISKERLGLLARQKVRSEVKDFNNALENYSDDPELNAKKIEIAMTGSINKRSMKNALKRNNINLE
jgi:hypothetical protein